ncbi:MULTISPECIES: carbohydrate kinase [unclassified Planococcus (in: firmicutes)]|uniref:carbohydrate kinase family protein n=1 Tax=unclassified Planococcus (in: firmicutes) TaxID=2662419 RepID=UPI000C3230F7|nr:MULTISPECIES: carbohydrate kinase [unclassified Planococcus (in: firmicutes)]AUD14797.1 carbohydrate kinase [Planococcus sp. MB-3u-03]PKG45112.1 carbohydrate kinase [Planococcus sp. Urea-trap-24]PKG87455.1 carbohydrate kinase [Planococcus sp. Urea-3u-39]PKH42580.1 carbohydrate kinase [Planococcus sp. MB-3u-09]
MNKKPSVVCIGELLIDFYCKDAEDNLVDGNIFEKQAGGAPANVCAAIVKLGGTALFCGKVGNDPFGKFLKNTLEKIHVDTSMLVFDDVNPTTLAFVSLMENGERDFFFNRGADAYLNEEEVDKGKLQEAAILHFGSATALLEGSFQLTYLNTMKLAKKDGQFVSFDPNYRSDLWKGKKSDFIELTKQGIAIADFVKVSQEELAIITGTEDYNVGIQILHQVGPSLIALTLGKKGTLISNRHKQELVSSIEIDSIDTTGAGDAFVGAMLYQLAQEKDPKEVLQDFEKIKKMTYISNKVGAIVCTRVGAISALPTLDEVI